MPVLEGRGLYKDFGGVAALRGVDLAVEAGQLVGLLGPNGSGKTTLLDILSGRLRPTAGQVRFRGRLVRRCRAWSIGRLGMGRTFQIPRPFAGLSVLDSVLIGVTFGRKERLVRAADRTREAERLLAIVGLADQADAQAGHLSLGQMKRLELAVALSSRPEVLLLDELASGLSPQGREQVLGFYGRLRARGVTIVAIEHAPRALARVADRLVLLDEGRLVADGRPADVLASPRLAASYLGEHDD